MEDMPRRHGTLSSTTAGEATVVEPSHEHDAQSDTASKVSMKEHETLCEVGALSNIADEESTEKGEAIPSLAGEAIGDGKGSGRHDGLSS